MSVRPEQCHYPPIRPDASSLQLLGGLASTHAFGAMDQLEVDPETYPFQGAYLLDGQKLEPSIIGELATDLEPRFNEAREVLRQPQQAVAVKRIGELLDAGKNVVLALPHGVLIDIGIAEAALYLELVERQHNFQTAILVSQTLQRLALKFKSGLVPTAEALGYMCDYVYFSNPKSARHSESEFASVTGEDYMSSHNRTLKQDLREKFDGGGLLLALAPSGTSDVAKDGRLVMATLQSGTINLLKHPNVFVQPLAAKFIGSDPFHYELAGVPRRIITDDDAHNVMHQLADSLNANLPDTYSYQPSK